MTEENSREKTAMRAGDFSQAMAEDDARRLAACWNACIGFSTPELENILMLGDTMRSRFEARNAAEREAEQELEALRHVYECVRGYLRFDGVDPARATAYAQQLQNAVEVVKEIDGGNFDPASKDRLSSTESGEHAAPQAVQQIQANCYSNDDGDYWRDCPDDCDFVEGLKVGDTFELQASIRAWSETYRVTKAPDDTSDDYEVELVSSDAPIATHPTTQGLDAVRELIALHSKELEKNPYAYFELAHTRQTGWCAWITDHPRSMPPMPIVNPDRKVLASGQGDTPDAACAAAIAAQAKQGGAA